MLLSERVSSACRETPASSRAASSARAIAANLCANRLCKAASGANERGIGLDARFSSLTAGLFFSSLPLPEAAAEGAVRFGVAGVMSTSRTSSSDLDSTLRRLAAGSPATPALDGGPFLDAGEKKNLESCTVRQSAKDQPRALNVILHLVLH